MKKLISILEILQKDNSIKKIIDCFNKSQEQNYIYGLAGSQKHAILASCYLQNPKTTIIITPSQENIDEWTSDLLSLLPDSTNILELPALDVMNVTATAKSLELKAQRMKVLGQLTRKEPSIILVSAQSAMQKDMSRQDFENSSVQLELSKEYEHADILSQLVNLGYEHVDKVERLGQFSSRGGIVDIFPVNSDTPVRIEFFDKEIESIREFDINSQRSVKNIAKCIILPLMRTDNAGNPALFLSYLKNDCTVILDEPLHLKESITANIKENPEIAEYVYNWNDILSSARSHNLLFTSLMMQRIVDTEPENLISIPVKTTAPFRRQFNLLCEELKNWLEQKNQILIALNDSEKIAYLEEILAENHINTDSM